MVKFKNFTFKLDEDYKTSEKRFLDQGADPQEVKAAIQFHKDNKNTFKPEWKNIDAIKDWKSFQKFIDDKQGEKKVKQSFKKEQDQLILRDDNEWLILLPLDHKTSCFHGSDTDWCVTKSNKQWFSSYFFKGQVILVFCIKKNENKDKWAIATWQDKFENSEFFDKNDNQIKEKEFISQTGLDVKEIFKGIKANEDYIEKKRQENIKKDINYIYNLAKKSGGPNKELENLIIATKNNRVAYNYAKSVLKGRWEEGEPIIAKDAKDSYEYALNVLKGERFKLGEPAITKDAEWAVPYAENVIKGRWKEAEPTISKNASKAERYANKIIKGRWKELEEKILNGPESLSNYSVAFIYAKTVVKGRWKEVESILIQDAFYGYYYAFFILKGRLDSGLEETYLNRHGYSSGAGWYIKELCNDMLFKWNGKEYFNEEDIINITYVGDTFYVVNATHILSIGNIMRSMTTET